MENLDSRGVADTTAVLAYVAPPPWLPQHLSHLRAAPLNVLAQMIVQLRGELDQGTGPTQQFSTYFIEISAAVIKRETTSSSGTSENGSNIISKKKIFSFQIQATYLSLKPPVLADTENY